MLVMSATKDNGNVMFFLSSRKTYVDNIDTKNLNTLRYDVVFGVPQKKYASPQDYIEETVRATNPNATEIKLVEVKTFSDDIKDFLHNEMYKNGEQIREDEKIDRRFSKISVSNPCAEPYMVTYSFKENGKNFKQTFITMFTYNDIEFTKRTNMGVYERINKRLWNIEGLYSYRAEERVYDKYFDDFIIFISNSMFNNRVKDVIEQVKKQMVIELGSSFRDVHSNSPLQNLPSELFVRYYEVAPADYSERTPMQIPTIYGIKWISNTIEEQNTYNYRNLHNIWNQKFYLPKKYNNIYYNKFDKELFVSTKEQKLPSVWKVLKPVEIKK